MIISHRWKFIFVRTAKTAGTSLEIALSKPCGPKDIITPIMRAKDEELRREHGGTPPQNYRRTLAQFTPLDLVRMVRYGVPLSRFQQHVGAREIRSKLPSAWRDYYKFAVTRNPWDRVLSYYHWRNIERTTKASSISEFVAGRELHHLHDLGWGRYTIDERIAVDRVLRYENLAEELEGVRLHLGLPAIELPRAKGTHRQDRRHHSQVLSKSDHDRIGEVFAPEIAVMGY